MKEYYFEEPHLIAGYRDNKFVGVMVTYPDEIVTKDDLMQYFDLANPTCFVAQELTEVEETVTPDNYLDVLDDLIKEYSCTSLTELNSELLYIPKTLH